MHDTQAAFFGNRQDSQLLKLVAKMSLTMDPRAPRPLKLEEKRKLWATDDELLRLKLQIASVKARSSADQTDCPLQLKNLKAQVAKRKRTVAKVGRAYAKETFFATIHEKDWRRVWRGEVCTEDGWVEQTFSVRERDTLVKIFYGDAKQPSVTRTTDTNQHAP